MAIIKCDNCGKAVSDNAPTCPHCKVQLKKESSGVESPTVANESQSAPPAREQQFRDRQTQKSSLMPSMMIFLILVVSANLFFDIFKYYKHKEIKKNVHILFESLEEKRKEVFDDYLRDLKSYETKSVYHQIYHANNAQLKMMDILVQENQLLLSLESGE